MPTFEDRFVAVQTLSGPKVRPRTIAEIDVAKTVLENLALKTLYISGSISVLELADKMRISFEVANDLFYKMRSEMLCQASGMVTNIPQISISAQGRSKAMELLAQCQYVGPTPVSLESYVSQVREQNVLDVVARPADVERAFEHLVIDGEMLRKFGTALNSGNAIYLFGPPGNGKTTMAECLSHAFAENFAWIPYAIEVDGEIITIFDPSIHVRMREFEPENYDARWVLCRRPTVKVGGELTVEMLDLQYNPHSKFYVGPMQMKANNGVLIIDDFGRQRISPSELLNRWVVPLDRRTDFLTPLGGKKIEIPFELLVVFASNINPYELGDPSFLRRIQTKIKLGAPTDEQFAEIFRRTATEHKVGFDPEIPGALIQFIQGTLKQELRSCFPRDIVRQACWSARYEDRKPYIDRLALKRAIDVYFLPAE